MQPFSGSVRQCQEVCITTLILKVIRDCKYLIIVRREIASRPEQIKENMAGGMKVVTEGLEVIKENMEKVDALVKEGDEAIKRLQDYIGEIALEKSEFTEGFLKDFKDAKKELRSARQTLFSLAEQTKAKGKRIEIMINKWDGQSKAVLKRSLRDFSALLTMSRTKLTAAKKTYNKAIDVFEASYLEGRKFKEHLTKMLDTETAEHKAWTAKVRTAYAAPAGVTVGMIVADIFGCLGFCSATVTTTVWATTLATVEATIASYTESVESLTEITEKFIVSLSELDSLTDGAVEFLEKEILIVIEWEENARNSEEIIEEFTEEELEEYTGYQDEIRSALTGLMDAVKKFLNQPKYVFDHSEMTPRAPTTNKEDNIVKSEEPMTKTMMMQEDNDDAIISECYDSD